MKKITTFHRSNLGIFGASIPCDLQGYVHLTQEGWRKAGYTRSQARTMANWAKYSTKQAEARLAEWQEGNA